MCILQQKKINVQCKTITNQKIKKKATSAPNGYMYSDGLQYSTFRFSFYIHRKSGFFIYRVVTLFFMLTVVSWFTLLFPPSEYDTRLQVQTGLILTSVTFLFAISEHLPKVQYLTLLDKYGYTCFSNMFIVALSTVIDAKLHLSGYEVN